MIKKLNKAVTGKVMTRLGEVLESIHARLELSNKNEREIIKILKEIKENTDYHK